MLEPASGLEHGGQHLNGSEKSTAAVHGFHERWFVLVAALTSLVLTLAAPVPWRLVSATLTEPWVLMLHHAFAHGFDFGRDLVFTYGPWGFLNTSTYHPLTYSRLLLGRIFLALAFWWAGWCMARRLPVNRWVALAWLWVVLWVGGMEMVTPRYSMGTDFRCFALLSSLLLLHCCGDASTATETPIVAATALICLIKVSFVIPAVAVLGAISVDAWWRQRRVPWAVPIFAAGLLLSWVLAAQPLSSVLPFMRNSASLIAGYAAAMNRELPDGPESMARFAAVAGLLTSMIAYALWRRMRWFSIVPLLAQLLILFTIFKAGFIRHDRHEVLALGALLLQTVLWCAAWWISVSPRWLQAAFVVPVAAAAIVTAHGVHLRTGETLTRVLKRALPVGSIRHAVRQVAGRERLGDQYEADLERLRERRPLPNVPGTVDIYPSGAHAILAHRFAYAPRPVVESYAAYTPELAELNAAHLRDRRAPDAILFDVRPFDGRFPSLSDGLSWPELLTRYDVKDTSGALLVLQRAAAPRAFTLALILRTAVDLTQVIAIPPLDRGPIWASIDIQPTGFGTLWSLLYKPAPLLLNVQTAGGQTVETRLVPALARAGFLLSPLIGDRMTFARLASSAWQRDLADAAVRTIQIVPTDGGIPQYVRTGVTLSLYRLEFPRVQ